MESVLQVLHLQGIRSEPPKAHLAANMSRYGMGTARSLADWERFAGVALKLQQVPSHLHCCSARVLPNVLCWPTAVHAFVSLPARELEAVSGSRAASCTQSQDAG